MNLWRADLLFGILHLDAEGRIMVEGCAAEQDPAAKAGLLLGLPDARICPGQHVSSVIPPLANKPMTILFQVGLGGLDRFNSRSPDGGLRAPGGLLKSSKCECSCRGCRGLAGARRAFADAHLTMLAAPRRALPLQRARPATPARSTASTRCTGATAPASRSASRCPRAF